DRVSNPTGSIGREDSIALRIEALDRIHKAVVACLDEIEYVSFARARLACDRYDHAQTSLNEPFLGSLVFLAQVLRQGCFLLWRKGRHQIHSAKIDAYWIVVQRLDH